MFVENQNFTAFWDIISYASTFVHYTFLSVHIFVRTLRGSKSVAMGDPPDL